MVVPLDMATQPTDLLEWPQFHNGVAAGLRLVPPLDLGKAHPRDSLSALLCSAL